MKIDFADEAPASSGSPDELRSIHPTPVEERAVLRLGDVLRKYDLIDEQQLEAALALGRARQLRLGQALIEMGILGEDQINWALAHHLGIPYLSLTRQMLSYDLIKRFPEALLRQHSVIPLVELDDELRVAFADPTDDRARDAIFDMVRKPVVLAIASRHAIRSALDATFSLPANPSRGHRANSLPRSASLSEWPIGGPERVAIVRSLLRGHGLIVLSGPDRELCDDVARALLADEALPLAVDGGKAALAVESAAIADRSQVLAVARKGLADTKLLWTLRAVDPGAALALVARQMGPALLAQLLDLFVFVVPLQAPCRGCRKPLDEPWAELIRPVVAPGTDVTLYQADQNGCEQCDGRGVGDAIPLFYCRGGAQLRAAVASARPGDEIAQAFAEMKSALARQARKRIDEAALDALWAYRQLPWQEPLP